jgi:DNA-binding transcriptional MerR regulator
MPAAQLLQTCDVVRMTGISQSGIIRAANRGLLKTAGRTRGGMRLYREADVRQYMAARKGRKG